MTREPNTALHQTFEDSFMKLGRGSADSLCKFMQVPEECLLRGLWLVRFIEWTGLNLVASVGIPSMSVIRLIAKLGVLCQQEPLESLKRPTPNDTKIHKVQGEDVSS